MRRKIICAVIGFIMLLISTASAASYTLPEKMQNQLAIGSGLKGSFTITSDGELSKIPFMNAVSDATYDLRGMTSGHDLHYYMFQESNGNQINLTELYRKDSKYYFRSDMVQNKILELSSISVYLDSLFAAKGENPSLSSALINYLSLSDDVKDKQWKPLISKYENALEMWLHDFTVQAEVVKQENGSSAFDFSYVIPISEVKNKLLSMINDFAGDAELQTLFDTIMTKEQKELYLNGALSWFYQQAINSLNIQSDVKLSKRVSALGDLINSRLILPLDSNITGYDTITIENSNGYSIYQLSAANRALVIGLPNIELLTENEFEKSVWLSKVDNEKPSGKEDNNFSIRADIKKTFNQFNDEEEKSHQTEHYSVIICEDTTYLPEDFQNVKLMEWHDIEAELDLHYHSKYSQNSATTLEIKANIKQNGSSVDIEGKIKTAAPWLFMPFDIKDPIEIGPDHPEITEEYITDWISNAVSMIHHSDTSSNEADQEAQTDSSNSSAEKTEALQKGSDVSDALETEPLLNEDTEAETEPLSEQETGESAE